MAKFEMSYTHLFEYIRQDKDRIRLVLSCKWDFKIKLTNNIVALTCEFRKNGIRKKGTGKNDWGGENGIMGIEEFNARKPKFSAVRIIF